MNKSMSRAFAVVIALAMLVTGAPIAMGFFAPPLAPTQQSAAITFADPAFQTTWQRTDLPVQNGKATRSWLWGPTSIFSGYEPWAESPGGKHLVQYFDKSRMEVNDPNADRKSQWFVTNGLLVVEMMTGKIMTGVNAYTQANAAAIPVAGDVSASVNAPTYASSAKVASLQGNNRAPDRTGQPVNQILDRAGNVSTATKPQDQVVNVVYEATLGHNIPNVFWTFMNQTGVVYQNGQYVTDKVFDWVFAMGYPLTEPYWIQISVGGQDHWVVMQAYQRRILTYDPNNDPAFQVEMGNVGQAYYNWRYNQQGAVLPTATPTLAPSAPTPTAVPPSLKLNPASGAANSTITVAGTGYLPFGAVAINVSASNIGYNQTVTTVGADGAGNFSTFITLPGEVAAQPAVTITALGTNGTPNLSQQYTITHSPTLNVSPSEVTSKGIVELVGADWSANTQVTITAYNASNNQAINSIQVTTDGNGAFKKSYTLAGKAAVGASYKIVGNGPNNQTATAPTQVRIIPQPTAHVNPFSGPAGVDVVFSGASWSANRLLSITMQGDNGQNISFPTPLNPVVTDSAGNFATNVHVPAEVAGQTEVRIFATDDTNGMSANAPYTLVNPVPPPANPKLNVVPNPVVPNQKVEVYGSGYPAGQIVSVGVGVVGGPQGPAASVSADNQGNFKATFTLSSSFANAGMVTISATSTNGTNASMNVPVASSGSGGGGGTPAPPNGLPLNVRVSYFGGPGTVKLQGTGWPAGQGLTAMVLSPDGSVNQTMGTGTVKGDGSFQIEFDQNSAWAGRTNLNVKVTAANGANSVRYLPVTTVTKTSGSTYSTNGANWPRGTKVLAQVYPVNGQVTSAGSTTTDANGEFVLNVTVPSNLVGSIRTIDLEAQGQPYEVSFLP